MIGKAFHYLDGRKRPTPIQLMCGATPLSLLKFTSLEDNNCQINKKNRINQPITD